MKAYLGAKGTLDFNSPSLFEFDDLRPDRVSVGGEIGAEVRAFMFSTKYSYEIVWTYPPENSLAAAPAEPVAQIVNETSTGWQPIGASDAADYSQFAPTAAAPQAFATGPQLTASAPPMLAQTSLLVSNVYTYTEPTLAVNQTTDNAALLWVHADSAKPAGQAQEINASIWNGSGWSAPVSLTDDRFADVSPSVIWVDDNTAVALWTRLPVELGSDAAPDAALFNQFEIATATYTTDTGTWSPVTLLTTNAAFDATPDLARNSADDVLAVWRQNDAGVLVGDATQPDQIQVSFYQPISQTWSLPATAVGDIAGLFELDAGYGDGAATIAYTRYTTGTNTTSPTLQLFTSDWNGTAWTTPVLRSSDPVRHRSPQVLYTADNQPVVVWLADSDLRLLNLATNQTASLVLPDEVGTLDNFRAVQDTAGNISAVFTAHEEQRDIYVSLYDAAANLWARPEALTNDPNYENYFSAAQDRQGRVLLGYTSTDVELEERTITIDSSEIITYTVPQERETDLLTLAHENTRNLSLTDDDFVFVREIGSPTATLSATVHNSGNFALDGVAVAFYAGDPATDGTLLGTATLPDPLIGGMSTTLTLDYTLPVNSDIQTFVAVADPDNSINENDETDNTAQLISLGADLDMQAISVRYLGGSSVELVTQVRNVGTTSSVAAPLHYYQADDLSQPITIGTIPVLDADETATVATTWSYGTRDAGTYTIVGIANQEAQAFEEADLTNNTAQTTVDVLTDLGIEAEAFRALRQSAGTVVISTTVTNVSFVDSPTSTLALYAGDVFSDANLLGKWTIPQLSGLDFATIEETLPMSITADLYAVIDPDFMLVETTRANNLIRADITSRIYLPYILRSGSNPAETPENCTDAYEPNNTQGTARLIAPGERQTHAFCVENDEDWLRFAATAGTTYRIETLNLESADTVMELYDANGIRIARNDDGGSGLASRIVYTFDTAGTYYVRINEYSGRGGAIRRYDVELVIE